MKTGSPAALTLLLILGTAALDNPALTMAAGVTLLFVGFLTRKLWVNRKSDRWGGGVD